MAEGGPSSRKKRGRSELGEEADIELPSTRRIKINEDPLSKILSEAIEDIQEQPAAVYLSDLPSEEASDRGPALSITQPLDEKFLDRTLTDPLKEVDTDFDLPLFALRTEQVIDAAYATKVLERPIKLQKKKAMQVDTEPTWLDIFFTFESSVVEFYSTRWVETLTPENVKFHLIPISTYLAFQVLPTMDKWMAGLTSVNDMSTMPKGRKIRSMQNWCQGKLLLLQEFFNLRGFASESFDNFSIDLKVHYGMLKTLYEQLVRDNSGELKIKVKDSTEMFRVRHDIVKRALRQKIGDKYNSTYLYQAYCLMELVCNIWDCLHMAVSTFLNSILIDRLYKEDALTNAMDRLVWTFSFFDYRKLPTMSRLSNYTSFLPYEFLLSQDIESAPSNGNVVPVLFPFKHHPFSPYATTTTALEIDLETLFASTKYVNKQLQALSTDVEKAKELKTQIEDKESVIHTLAHHMFEPLRWTPRYLSQTCITHLFQMRMPAVGQILSRSRLEGVGEVIDEMKATNGGELPAFAVDRNQLTEHHLLWFDDDINTKYQPENVQGETSLQSNAAADAAATPMTTESMNQDIELTSEITGASMMTTHSAITTSSILPSTSDVFSKEASKFVKKYDGFSTNVNEIKTQFERFDEIHSDLDIELLTIDQIETISGEALRGTGLEIKLPEVETNLMNTLKTIFTQEGNAEGPDTGSNKTLVLSDPGRLLYFLLFVKKVVGTATSLIKEITNGYSEMVAAKDDQADPDNALYLNYIYQVDRFANTIEGRMNNVVELLSSENSVLNLVKLIERYEGTENLEMILGQSGQSKDRTALNEVKGDVVGIQDAFDLFENTLKIETDERVLSTSRAKIVDVMQVGKFVLASAYMCLEKTFHLLVSLPYFSQWMETKRKPDQPKGKGPSRIQIARTTLGYFFPASSINSLNPWSILYKETGGEDDGNLLGFPDYDASSHGSLRRSEAISIYQWYAKPAIEFSKKALKIGDAPALEKASHRFLGILLSLMSPNFSLFSNNLNLPALKGAQWTNDQKEAFASKYWQRQKFNVIFEQRYMNQGKARSLLWDPTIQKPDGNMIALIGNARPDPTNSIEGNAIYDIITGGVEMISRRYNERAIVSMMLLYRLQKNPVTSTTTIPGMATLTEKIDRYWYFKFLRGLTAAFPAQNLFYENVIYGWVAYKWAIGDLETITTAQQMASMVHNPQNAFAQPDGERWYRIAGAEEGLASCLREELPNVKPILPTLVTLSRMTGSLFSSKNEQIKSVNLGYYRGELPTRGGNPQVVMIDTGNMRKFTCKVMKEGLAVQYGAANFNLLEASGQTFNLLFGIVTAIDSMANTISYLFMVTLKGDVTNRDWKEVKDRIMGRAPLATNGGPQGDSRYPQVQSIAGIKPIGMEDNLKMPQSRKQNMSHVRAETVANLFAISPSLSMVLYYDIYAGLDGTSIPWAISVALFAGIGTTIYVTIKRGVNGKLVQPVSTRKSDSTKDNSSVFWSTISQFTGTAIAVGSIVTLGIASIIGIIQKIARELLPDLKPFLSAGADLIKFSFHKTSDWWEKMVSSIPYIGASTSYVGAGQDNPAFHFAPIMEKFTDALDKNAFGVARTLSSIAIYMNVFVYACRIAMTSERVVQFFGPRFTRVVEKILELMEHGIRVSGDIVFCLSFNILGPVVSGIYGATQNLATGTAIAVMILIAFVLGWYRYKQRTK